MLTAAAEDRYMQLFLNKNTLFPKRRKETQKSECNLVFYHIEKQTGF